MQMVRESGSTTVVVLDDAVQLEDPSLRDLVSSRLAAGASTLVFDVSGVSRLSSTVLSTLLWAQRSCQRRGGRVVLRGPSRQCRDMLVRTGLRRLFLEETGAARRGLR